MTENISVLELSEEKYKILFELSPLGMAMIDYETGKFLEVNQSLLNSINYTKEEFLSLSFYDITPKKYDEQEKQQIKDLETKRKFGPIEKEYIKKDGTKYPIIINGFSFTNTNNRKVVWCIIEDITEKKQYEVIYNDNKYLLEFIAIENSLQKVLDKIVYLAEKRNPEIICSILLLDETKQRLYTGAAPSLPKFYNDAVNGTRIGEKIGSCGSAAYKKQRVIIEDIDTHENWKHFLQLTKKANLHACWSQPIISSQNKVLGTFAIYYEVIKSPNGFMLNLIETYANIAAKAIEKNRYSEIIQKNTKELEEKTLLLENILDTIPDMVWLKDKNGVYLRCNLEFEKFVDKKESEIIGKTDYDFVNKRIANRFIANDKIAMETKKVIRTKESITYKKNNQKIVFDTAKISMENLNGEIIGILGIGHDITQREKEEKELKKLNELTLSLTKSQQALLSLFDKGDSTLFKWKNEKNWPIEYVSLSIKKLFAYSRNEFISAKIPYLNYIYKDDVPRVLSEVNSAIKENKSYFQHEPYRIITKDKQLKWVLDCTTIQKNDKGEITHFIGNLTDISDQIHNQELLYNQSKIASLGEMLENIAHQWRQPLSIISTIATGAKLKKELNILNDEEFIEDMEKINNQSQYLSSTIDDFRDFFSPNDYIKNQTKLKDSLKKAFSLIKDSYKSSNITIIQDLDEDTSLLYNENIFIQAIINILNNAKDALNKLENKYLDKYVFVTLKKEKDFYTIKIKDTANGINEDSINKIFEPYFTTKHKEQGIGIGLYMTNQIITKHLKSTISVQNVKYTYLKKDYKGAEFCITIPFSL
jgi:PAS domain S-box-containing protein